MNFYVVAEGLSENAVYREWIPLANPDLSPSLRIDDVRANHFFLISARGYPSYFDVIDAAIQDVNHNPVFDRLVVSADSEELSFDEKFAELDAHIRKTPCRIPVAIVVQHFCLEAWALGNRLIVRPNTQSARLRTYRRIHDVRTLDPELLPANPAEGLNRAQFANRYLVAALNDRFRNLTYSKADPIAILHPKYFEQLKRRLDETGHIHSFSSFLAAFL